MTQTSLTSAFAFDLDDTLYSEYEYVMACIRHVARQYAPLTEHDSNELYSILSLAPNVYDALCACAGEKSPSLVEFLETYRNTRPARLTLRNDAYRLLKYLHDADIPMYLITDGRSVGQRAKISALGLTEFFTRDHIIISEEIGADKHTPVPFVTAMERELGNHYWTYIGDNPAKDFLWPRRLGWATVMLAEREKNVHSQDLDDYPTENHPMRTVISLDEVFPILESVSVDEYRRG